MKITAQDLSLPVQIPLNGSAIYGNVELPPEAVGLVIFVPWERN
jgi:hypothetical protein